MTIKEKNACVPYAISQIISERGLKQKAVAARCGMSSAQFTAILTGRKLLTPVDILSVARALDVSPKELFQCYTPVKLNSSRSEETHG